MIPPKGGAHCPGPPRWRQNVSGLGGRRRLIAKDRGTTVLGCLVRGFGGFFRGLRLGWGLSRGGGTWRGRGGTLGGAIRRANSRFFARILVKLRNIASLAGPS